MGGAASCSGKLTDILSEEEIQAAIKSIKEWEDTQKAGQRANQALRTVRKDSFRKAANELNHKGGIVDRLGGPDRVHDIIQAFYRKLFHSPDVQYFFENLPSDRMRAKQMKFMRYLVGGPSTYAGNLRCKHLHLVQERGLDLQKFQIVKDLLLDTFKEMEVPQDVVDDILVNVEEAKTAIFTPNPDELVTAEEMAAAGTELQNPLITRLGGPQAVQAIIQAFYKKLFTNEQLKYFFASMSAERLRNMQFKFMRYLLCGPASYALTGGNMRCIHARMVKENGLDLDKFNMVVNMLTDVLNGLMVAKRSVREILSNVESAREAIFTPGPDELVSKEEMVAEAASLGSDIVERLGGPEAVYDFISRFYAKLFNDSELKYFFLLSTERLRAKQFRFMRYLLAGSASYTALGGNLRCRHLALIRDKGLNTDMFDRAGRLLKEVVEEMGGVPPDVEEHIFKNVASAKAVIFTPGPEELVTREEVMAAAEALNSDLVSGLGGSGRVFNVVTSFYTKIFHDEQLKYFFASLSAEKLRAKQFKVMTYLFSGPDAYAVGSGGTTLRCVHAKMVKESGLDIEKFNRVAQMMLDTLKEEEAPEDVVAGVLKNVESAREAIFTPGPDELVSKEEMMAEAASLGSDIVERLGGPEAVYDFISRFYAKLFNDSELKYFFVLAADRLRSKQFKFMRYLIGGSETYTGDLRCIHASMVAERGLDAAKFQRAVSHLLATASEMNLSEDVISDFMSTVKIARNAILGGGGGDSGGGGGSNSTATAATTTTGSGAASTRSLYERLGGDVAVGKLVDAVHARIKSMPNLAHIYDGTDMMVQRSRQLAFLKSVWGGGGSGSRPGSVDGLTMGIAHIHMARHKALTAAHFEAIAEVWIGCLTAQDAPVDTIAEVRSSLVAADGKSLIYPPAGPAAGGCPFASSFGQEDETSLNAVLAAAATGGVPPGPNAATAASDGRRPASSSLFHEPSDDAQSSSSGLASVSSPVNNPIGPVAAISGSRGRNGTDALAEEDEALLNSLIGPMSAA